MITKEEIKRKTLHRLERVYLVFKWVSLAIIIGIVVAYVCIGFAWGMNHVTQFRLSHPFILLALPIGGVFLTLLYNLVLKEPDSGTNAVIEAIQTKKHVPIVLAPLIFISTIITHLIGGSAGREGAALQIGGSIGNFIGSAFKQDEDFKHIMIMTGMSAAFSALFGTPMAAAVFAMEVISVGIMHYAALVPCVVSAIVARFVADYYGFKAESYAIGEVPDLTVLSATKTTGFAILCGFVSILFCLVLKYTRVFLNTYIKNAYIKALICGISLLILTVLVGNQTYNGTGTNIIAACFEGGDIRSWTFLLKMLFTALTLSGGYKGGEIVPTLFIGSTFGFVIAGLFNMPTGLFAAVGMGAVFCGVTNCPISSLLICFELFGYKAMPYYLIAIAFSYLTSGYGGLYSAQKIVYSKYRSNYINKKVH